jgi:ribosomal-protein-alanine N-acetyltransferase
MDKLNNFFGINMPEYYKNYEFSAKEISLFHTKCFNEKETPFSKKNIYYFLKSSFYQIYYNKLSLAIIQVVGSEAELITIAVDPDKRNRNLGSTLLKDILDRLQEIKVKTIFLEVSMANQSAISMYKKNKFFQCGDRKNYYKLNETERIDAVVMSRILTKKN